MDISSWYNNSAYSDLTVRLRDGREIKLHKIVLCNTNDWFKKACGLDSRFVEVKQNVIELEDDAPDAIDTVLHHIYKIPIGPRHPSSDENPWRFWLDVHVTADKYLVPALSEQACKYFFDFARSERNLDEVTDILETLETEMSHDDEMSELAAELRNKHLRRLLQNKRYREKVQDDKELMWEHVDQLLRADQVSGADQVLGADQELHVNGKIEMNIPPGKTYGCFITNSGRLGDRVKVRCESSLGADGSLRLFKPISQYP